MLGLLITILVYLFKAINFPPKILLFLAASQTFFHLFGRKNSAGSDCYCHCCYFSFTSASCLCSLIFFFFFFFSPNDMSVDCREREQEGEKHLCRREKHQQVASHSSLDRRMGDQICKSD